VLAIMPQAIMPQRTELAVEKWFARHGGKPPGLATLHYNAVRGQDAFGGVRCLVMISRPQLSAGDLERIAWTLTGVRGTPAPDGKLPMVPSGFIMRDSPAQPGEAARHPDPWVERIRFLICDTELLQGEGRGRAVRRTPEWPLTVEILTSAPLPLEIDRLVYAEEILADAHPARWLVAAGVVPVLGSRGSRALLAALLGAEPNAIRVMLQRDPTWEAVLGQAAHGAQMPYKDPLMANVHREEFRVRLTPEDRYAASVWIEAKDAIEADARLRALGVVAHQIHHTDKPPNQMLDAFDEARPGLGAEPAGAGLPGGAAGPVDEGSVPVDTEPLDAASLAQPPAGLLTGHLDDAPYPGCPADDGDVGPPLRVTEPVPGEACASTLEEENEMREFDQDGWHAVVEAAEPLEGADADHASPLHNAPMPAPWLMTAALVSRSSVVASPNSTSRRARLTRL